MAKQLLYSDQARSAILSGVNQLANAVKAVSYTHLRAHET